jgi:hypothetical protein
MLADDHLEHGWFKRFGKRRPDVVRSIEERLQLDEQTKAAKREAKRLGREIERSP